MKKTFLLLAGLTLTLTSFSQYNSSAGSNAPVAYKKVQYYDEMRGVAEERVDTVQLDVRRDSFGNADGSNYDLAVDGAFEGQTIVVLHLYTGESFDFSYPKEALASKGFSVYRYLNYPPDADSLKRVLAKACQLWVISDRVQKLNAQHVEVIREFFEQGHGVYIWGDNEPYYADANYLSMELIGIGMSGNDYGDQQVGVKTDSSYSGILRNHLLTTGLEHIYEGITIASIGYDQSLTPLIWGSNGKTIAAVYQNENRRLILDGGFTRLYVKWDTAGTGRYVKNAAAWLVNYELFGDSVLSEALRSE